MTAPTTAPVSTLVEIGELIRSRPCLDAAPEQVAAWYEQKSVVLRHIAAETGDRDAEECGRVAHEHAVALLARHNVLSGGLPRQGQAGGIVRVGVAQ